jgi:hypothetical protein
MKLAGEFLTQTKPTASKRVPRGRLMQSTKAALSNIAKFAGLDEKQTFIAFGIKLAAASKGRATKIKSTPSRYHVAIGTPHRHLDKKVKRGVAIVAKELNGHIIGYRIYHQR